MSANGSNETTLLLPDTQAPLQLEDHPIENFRPLKIIVIGAGYSGIYQGIRIPERIRNFELVIYEKNAGPGGAWWENRYPGCACDVPAYLYQYSFNPNPSWTQFYAPAKEIRDYLHDTAKKFSADRFIKCNHHVLECKWDDAKGKWKVVVENTLQGEIFTDEADVLINARGALNDYKWPQIEGFNEFLGKKVHSAAWDESFDYSKKRIAVIGGGSSAVQIVPELQRLPGTQLSCFVRSKSWIGRPFGEAVANKLDEDGFKTPEQRREKIENDPEYYYNLRRIGERDINDRHALTFKGSKMQAMARGAFRALMKQRLQKKPEVFDAMVPDFGVSCRRLTPGLDYLEALAASNVDFISKRIKKITDKGLILEDGTEVNVDVIVCATGFDASAPPRFSVVGRNNINIADRFAEFPETYMSVVTDGFPNYFMMLGPNSALATGSLTVQIEAFGDYICKAIRKIQRDGIKAMEIQSRRVKDFSDYCNEYFKRTVFVDNCNSWYRFNGDGDRISGLWPGSTLHALEAAASPRWEDYEYVYHGERRGGDERNRLLWFGNGWSELQINGGETAYYIDPMFQDVPSAPLPEDTPKHKMRAFCY